jgi:NADPH-dependent 2,4-dienoyl-CoA reductase/sulfur reductase-like enzyme
MTRVVVVGAGPAGLSAASAALDAGADVTVLDAAPALGGQFWRHRPADRAGQARLQHGWPRFTALRDALTANARCRVVTSAQVWAVDQDAGQVRLHVAVGEADHPSRSMESFQPQALVLATGAHDHTLPFPGWDLPGVVTGGAAQALAKADGVAVGGRVVVAGAGPFLLPVAASLAAVGARVLGVHEASRPRALAAGWSRSAGWSRAAGWGQAAIMPRKLGELAGYAGRQLRGRIPYRLGTGVVAARGDGRLEEVTIARLDERWAPVPGTERVIACDAVAVSHGFTPRLELAIAAGCALSAGGPFDRFVTVDADQRTSVPGVYAAGEITGIGGADAALSEGALAGWIAGGGAPDAPRARAARRGAAGYRSFSRGLAAAHGIRPGWRRWLDDTTVVCRCEEVTYGALTGAAGATAARGLRSLKLVTRAGLGPCQGRVCGRTVEALLTRDGARPFLDGVLPDRRPMAALVRFAELAQSPIQPHERPEP